MVLGVSTAGTNFFKFSLSELPESNSYVSTSSSITYTTNCTHTNGAISAIEAIKSGSNYDSCPMLHLLILLMDLKQNFFVSMKILAR